MKRSRLHKVGAAFLVLGLVGVTATFFNSSRFNPDLSGDQSFIARAQQKSAPGIKVSVSVLGAGESQRSFDENLAKYNIQPVWLSIQNDTDDQLVFLPISMDRDYYSPFEVSYRFHGLLSFAANRARDSYFLRRQIASTLPPHSTTTGFVYGVLDNGVKYAHIVIAGNDRYEAFDFALPIPGPSFVGTNVKFNALYPGKNIENLQLDALRSLFAKQPCCTTNAGASRDGDPLNLVIIESQQNPIVPFIARGWHLARTLNVASAIQTARAFLFRDAFLTSPVSPLYVYGRSEDFVLQKARSTIKERVHARFWLTPYTFEGRRVWIGQVSRDIGVRLTYQTWNLTTHKIAPDVDFDRNYLLQDLLLSGFVERYGFVTGVGAAPPSAPRTNLTGDPYYTDGLRAVVFLSNQRRSLGDVDRLPWEIPMSITVEKR
ncbi:MAG: LssY C-terminal domain-containing protein [Xanthobacteraceae bacterium]